MFSTPIISLIDPSGILHSAINFGRGREINHKAVVIRTVLLTATAGLNGDKRRNATVIRLISSLLEDFIFCLWLVRF